MEKKKILMIIPRLAAGGAERVVSNLTLNLSDVYKIDILLDYNSIEYPYNAQVLTLSSECEEPKGIRQIALYIKKYIILRKMKKQKKYDAYISHSRISDIINVLSGYKKENVILTKHCSLTRPSDNNIKEKILQKLERYAYTHAPKVIAVSDGVKEELEELFGIKNEKIRAIWNGSDINKIKKLAQEELLEEQKQWFQNSTHVVVGMGRYIMEKGFGHLIRAFSRVINVYPDAKLILLGEGELRSYYEKLICEMNLSEHVILAGFQENPYSVIKHSNVFVFSSVTEGFGYALAETICCSIPCIVTEFSKAAREILGYSGEEDKLRDEYRILETGILSPVCSGTLYSASEKLEEAEIILANSIVYALEHPKEMRQMVNCNQKREHLFSLSRMADKWMEFIEE